MPGELLDSGKRRHIKCKATTVLRTTEPFFPLTAWHQESQQRCGMSPVSLGGNMLSSPSHLLAQKHCKKNTFGARQGPARAVPVPDLHLFITVMSSAWDQRCPAACSCGRLAGLQAMLSWELWSQQRKENIRNLPKPKFSARNFRKEGV